MRHRLCFPAALGSALFVVLGGPSVAPAGPISVPFTVTQTSGPIPLFADGGVTGHLLPTAVAPGTIVIDDLHPDWMGPAVLLTPDAATAELMRQGVRFHAERPSGDFSFTVRFDGVHTLAPGRGPQEITFWGNDALPGITGESDYWLYTADNQRLRVYWPTFGVVRPPAGDGQPVTTVDLFIEQSNAPEPGTLALAALGLLGVGLFRGRCGKGRRGKGGFAVGRRARVGHACGRLSARPRPRV